MDKLYIVMPAYNEEANIESVVRDWYPLLEGKSEDSRLVVADSGSSDATHELLGKLQEEMPKLVAFEDSLKQHGPKLIALYKKAVDEGADWVFQTDSDGQTNPSEFDFFWNNRNEYDAILGYRPVRGDGKSRAMVEKVVCLLLKIFFGVKVPDANAPFRLMRCSLVEKYIGKFREDYNIPNIILTAYYAYFKEKVLFKTITFKPRQGGVNSIDLKKIFKIGVQALKDFAEFRKDMRKA